MLRIDYSRTFLIQGFLVSFVWLYTTTYIRKNAKKLCLYAIPNFDLEPLKKHKNINLFVVDENSQLSEIKHGLVVDLHHNITAEQEKFIADCSINNIRVFHSESIREIVEGKVQTQHLSENSIGTLQPNPIYFHVKRIWESILIIASLPITLPIMFITAILIKIENPGPAMFYQERVGQGGKVFKIYKFRSMTVRHKDAKSKFATEEQARVTRIGKVIRKVRIDELPQFLNVLKGEMALIGPRPEQQSFVKQFEQEIPFYGYRHMVKPGITGWAQTVQGYTDDVDSTREKLAHDLYYIKHLSIWLDINIVFKTIKTMMTGFGAK
ncbi:MAG TPA: UDP-glucose lipid carrier transferase [Vibrio sp.]|nr:UDP-glucose lipid carrier transferase [Vibrio sp.]